MNKRLTKIMDDLFIQQNGCCIYCDKKIPRNKCTLEHIVPGFNHISNYRLSCQPCNSTKSGFFLFYTIPKKITEEMIYRSLVMQLYVMKQFINHLWE